MQTTIAASPLAALAAGVLTVAAALPFPAHATILEGGPPASACVGASTPDPAGLYGDVMSFRVLRNGKPIGRHDVRFERRGDDLVVRSTMTVEVSVLFVTAYRYEYESIDTWRDGCLVALDARIDDNGEQHSVRARANGEMLRIQGPNGSLEAPLGTFPTNHWNADVLGSRVVLNTITGGLNEVEIVQRGITEVAVNGGTRPARHFAYTGELQTEVWYDDQGRWVRMAFSDKGGSSIEYVCEQCSREQTARR